MKYSECTMLANNSTNLKHNFDFSNPKVLHKEQNWEKRLILRMIEIVNNKNSSPNDIIYLYVNKYF